MKRLIAVFTFAFSLIFSSYSTELTSISTTTDLSKRPFKITRINVTGKSRGFLFAFLFGTTPSESHAINNLLLASVKYLDQNKTIINLNTSKRYIITPIGLFIVEEARADIVQYDPVDSIKTAE